MDSTGADISTVPGDRRTGLERFHFLASVLNAAYRSGAYKDGLMGYCGPTYVQHVGETMGLAISEWMRQCSVTRVRVYGPGKSGAITAALVGSWLSKRGLGNAELRDVLPDGDRVPIVFVDDYMCEGRALTKFMVGFRRDSFPRPMLALVVDSTSDAPFEKERAYCDVGLRIFSVRGLSHAEEQWPDMRPKAQPNAQPDTRPLDTQAGCANTAKTLDKRVSELLSKYNIDATSEAMRLTVDAAMLNLRCVEIPDLPSGTTRLAIEAKYAPFFEAVRPRTIAGTVREERKRRSKR